MKTTFLAKILILILATVLLSTVLTVLFFNYTGISIFAKQKAEELSPRAKFIAEMTGEYLQGRVGSQTFERAIGGMEYRIWDASVYIYDSRQTVIAYYSNKNTSRYLGLLSKYVANVLSGETLTLPLNSDIGVLMGEPVLSDDNTVIGAVFLIKPMGEVKTALGGLVIALVISMLVVVTIMMIPAYLTSKRMTRPLKQITGVALSMAKGDFSVRAEEEGSSELVSLAKSFNLLSDELSNTISRLMFEKNKLRAVINGIKEGIIAVDREGYILYYNDGAIKLLGGNEGDKITDIVAYSDVSEAAVKVFGDEPCEHQGEIRTDGKILAYSVTPLFDDGKVSREAVVLLRDITESARLEQTRRDYVANVSHELRTPIASIRSLADALNDGLVKNDADRARYYGYILKESIRLSHLIDDLLELSRLQSGTLVLEKYNFDILELLYDIPDRFSTLAQENSMEIVLDVKDEIAKNPMVYSNPERIEEVLVVLTDNAIKHGEKGEVIISSSEGEDDEVVITVSNNGEIAKEDIEHIFERFYKVDKSHSGKGTGLGLSIASETVALLGGRIWAKSADGRVEFSVSLKRKDVE